MEHLAIMKKSWKLTEKILSGRKKIESRWYLSKKAPWGKIKPGEKIYFKDSGEPVSLVAEVDHVIEYEQLTPEKVKSILEHYGEDDGIEKQRIPYFFELFQHKRYCILIFLKNPQRVEPIAISKKGFGNMAAWITVSSINLLKK